MRVGFGFVVLQIMARGDEVTLLPASTESASCDRHRNQNWQGNGNGGSFLHFTFFLEVASLLHFLVPIPNGLAKIGSLGHCRLSELAHSFSSLGCVWLAGEGYAERTAVP